MNILAVTNMYPDKGRPSVGTFVEQQIKGLQQAGIEAEVFFVDRARGGVGMYSGLGRKVKARIARRHPDLVHVMYGGVMADLVTRSVREVPTIVSFCGSDLLGENLPGVLRKLMVAYGVRASHRAARRAAGIIVKSRNLYNALPKGLDSERIEIISNGIDLNRFQPMDPAQCRQQLGWNPDGFHVLFPANAGTPRKRLWLAEAALKAAEGTGLKSAELHLLKEVPHHEVPQWLNASHVVLLTSEHEGSPNVIKEALACNVPVVSVDVGDVAERVEGIEGCFISEPTAESLGECLARVQRANRRVEGRMRMAELSLENVSERLAAFYHRAIEDWKKARGIPQDTRRDAEGCGRSPCETL